MIYDEAYNETFHQKHESIQYNACREQLDNCQKRETLQRIRLGIPPISKLVHVCLFILYFQKKLTSLTFRSNTNENLNSSTSDSDKITLFQTT